ncbi:MAG: acetyl esterase [Planctomycetota bacterium]|jgi:acetyl esterase
MEYRGAMRFASVLGPLFLSGLVFAGFLGSSCGDGGSEGGSTTTGADATFEGGVVRSRTTYKSTAQGPLDLYVYATEQAGHELRPAVVLFHGGRWEEGHPKQFQSQCIRLAQRGMLAISADYRVELTHGTSPVEAVMDAKSAIRWVRDNADRLGVDPNRVAAGGGSAGGHIASAAATIPEVSEGDSETSARPDALVLFSGLVDMTPRTGLGYAKLGEAAIKVSPLHHLDGDEPPTLILHGRFDDVASLESVQLFSDRLKASGVECELVIYEAGHGFFNEFNDSKAFADTLKRMEGFFEGLGWIRAAQ